VRAGGQGPRGEAVTPTGAAILTTLVDSFGALPAMTIEDGYAVSRAWGRIKQTPTTLMSLVTHRQALVVVQNLAEHVIERMRSST
jgi:uncharacterized protein (DUF111 family)